MSVTDLLPRKTRQRDAIRHALEVAARPLSPAEILAAAREATPSLGVATVYRTIKGLVEQGWAVAVELPGEPPRFELSGKHHHHHFLCRACDRTFEIDGCAQVLPRLPRGFAVESHEIFLYGLCAECSKTGRRRGFEPERVPRHR
jgi:Fur family ferric uptake transcriptional regulator